jgi:N-acyl-D-aspartate/D-glutamate deacylase
MTSMPAARLRLADRGLLRPAMKADIVVFDPAAVADKATFLNPRQFASGFDDVLVNGRPVILKGVLTEERPGTVLHGPAWENRRRKAGGRAGAKAVEAAGSIFDP